MDNEYSNTEVKKGSPVATAPFAGRLGGNQEFIASPDDRSLLERQPDAVSFLDKFRAKTDFVHSRHRCDPCQSRST